MTAASFELFTSRQCRKTLVVNMIENGATHHGTYLSTTFELGHSQRNNIMEVKSAGDWQKWIPYFLKAVSICCYPMNSLIRSHSRRKTLLYVDFRFRKASVEFGFCAK